MLADLYLAQAFFAKVVVPVLAVVVLAGLGDPK